MNRSCINFTHKFKEIIISFLVKKNRRENRNWEEMWKGKSYDEKYSLHDKNRWIISKNYHWYVLFKHFEHKIVTIFRFHHFHSWLYVHTHKHTELFVHWNSVRLHTTAKISFHQNMSCAIFTSNLVGRYIRLVLLSIFSIFFFSYSRCYDNYKIWQECVFRVLEASVWMWDSSVVCVWVFVWIKRNGSYYEGTLTRIIHS